MKLRDFTAPGRGGVSGGEAAVADDGSSSGRPSFVNVHDTGTRPVPPGPVAMVTTLAAAAVVVVSAAAAAVVHVDSTPSRRQRARTRTPPAHVLRVSERASERARARTHTFSLCAAAAPRHTAP